MNDYRDIIIAPVITEKAAVEEQNGKYTFKVSTKANKTQIKQAIEKIFNVKVESVNTLNSHPKKRRVGKYTGMTNKYKKAINSILKNYNVQKIFYGIGIPYTKYKGDAVENRSMTDFIIGVDQSRIVKLYDVNGIFKITNT